MAAKEMISDNDNNNTHISAVEYANPMGNCVSAGKKKVCKESSPSSSSTSPTKNPCPLPSSRRFQDMAKQIISTSARSSSTGTDRRRVSIMPPSSQSMARGSSPGKERHFSHTAVVDTAAAASSRSFHTPSSSVSNHGHSHHTASSSIPNHGHSHHTASSGVLNPGHSHHTASRGADIDPDPSRGVLNYGHPHHTALSGTDINAAPMQSQLLCHAQVKLPSSLHKLNSTPLKPRANAGSTSRKPADGFHGRSTSRKSMGTSAKMDPDDDRRATSSERTARVTETLSKGQTLHSDTKGFTSEQRAKEPCKDCKVSTLESICYIANDGSIAATRTGGALIRHFHYCNSPRCAANPNYRPSPSAPSKKVLVSKRRSPLSQAVRTKSSTPSCLGDHRSICSSTTSSLYGDDWDAQKGGQESKQSGIDQNTCVKKWSEDEGRLADIDTDSHCGVSVDQNGSESCGLSPSRDCPTSVLMQGTEDQESCRGSGNAETGTCCSRPAAPLAAPHILSDAHDDEKSYVNRDEGEELIESKSFFYHGDNEYSCSDDGTEVATTPKSSTNKSALDDLSNTDFEQSTSAKSSQARRSNMAMMRRKYLNFLKEQEAETVRLRKQEIQARKQAGDWMLDCAMEEVVHKLAPNGEARVKVLVEAFETIMHHSDSEGSQTHHQDHALQGHNSLENSSESMPC